MGCRWRKYRTKAKISLVNIKAYRVFIRKKKTFSKVLELCSIDEQAIKQVNIDGYVKKKKINWEKLLL